MDHYTSAIGLCTITTAQPASMQGTTRRVGRQLHASAEAQRRAEPRVGCGRRRETRRTVRAGTACPPWARCRAQLFSELANGAKGITWFIFGSYEDIDPKPALWDEAGRLGATLVETRGWLSHGDLDPGALRGASADLEVGVVSAPEAVVVPVLDLRYRLKPKGYVWGTRHDVQVSVALPAWLTGDVSVSQVRADATTRVPFTRDGDVVTATIPSLDVGTILVIELVA